MRIREIMIASLFLANVSVAQEPGCEGPSPSEIDVSDDNTLSYCAPTTSGSGDELPAGEAISCFVTEDGNILHQADNVAPGSIVSVTLPDLRFIHNFEVYCQNSAGDGGVASAAYTFPGDVPGTPVLLP